MNTMEEILRTLAKNSGIDLTAIDIGNKLKQQWKNEFSGGCKIISKGDNCDCHLCLIDELVSMVYNKK